MKRHISIILTIVLTICWSCKNDRVFPEVRKLSEYKKTDFLPTLEHKISKDRNSIYSATLLYAWNEIQKEIEKPLQISPDLYDLTLLDNSKSYFDALKGDEYSANGQVNGSEITAKAEFKKSLPFDLKLNSFENKLVFEGKSVASFGLIGYDFNLSKLIKIDYYMNNNNFILTLLPKDKNHEIILFKSDKEFGSISKMHEEIEKLRTVGINERKDANQIWKYIITDEDEIIIPKFNFNIETNYLTLEGNKFKTDEQNYQIETAWQRMAFILDESGAEIESESEIEVAVEESEEEFEKPKPKKLVFDKSFLTLLKRTDAKYPYFGLWTTNTELMIKK